MRNQPRYRRINSPFVNDELMEESMEASNSYDFHHPANEHINRPDEKADQNWKREDLYDEPEILFESDVKKDTEEENENVVLDEEYWEDFEENDPGLKDKYSSDVEEIGYTFLDEEAEPNIYSENELSEDEWEETYLEDQKNNSIQHPKESESLFDSYLEGAIQEESLEEQFLGTLKSLFNQWNKGRATQSTRGNTQLQGTIVDLRPIAKITRKGTTKNGSPYYTVSRRKNRPLTNVVGIVLHQMAFNRDNDHNSYLKTGAHYIILRDGKIGQLYDHDINLNAAQGFNSTTLSVEFAGNFPNSSGKWWHSKGTSAANRSRREHRPTLAQIQAGRYLLQQLINDPSMPNFKHVFAHRQSSRTRSNDPGPDIWCKVGEWAINNLGYQDAGQTIKGQGKSIPPDWKQCQ